MNNTFYYENNLCGLKQNRFQKISEAKETDLFILTNDNGAEMASPTMEVYLSHHGS